jgi:aconitate hydratase
MPSLTEKIVEAHLAGRGAGDLELSVDQALLEDATGTMACLQFERLGCERVRTPLVVSYVDHNVVQFDERNPNDHLYLRSCAARYGMKYSRPGNGISHYVHLERFARPGHVLVGADSHTTMAGAAAMLAVGAGSTDVALVMAGLPYVLADPVVVGVRLDGELPPWVEAKDVILELLRRRGVRGGRGRIFEFFGPGVASIGVAGRGTICNMIVETGRNDRPSSRATRRRGAGSRRRIARTSGSRSRPTTTRASTSSRRSTCRRSSR